LKSGNSIKTCTFARTAPLFCELKGRINVVEYPEQLIFSNVGDFIPGSVENVIAKNSPPELYRNPFLSNAMVHLNMIDTIGGGIRKMFEKQKQRFFPLPDYDLSEPVQGNLPDGS
jgi:ATP-dependent DNA helicase RecG